MPPDLLEPPVAPTPTPTPSPTMDAFDSTFADLEPSPTPTPSPEPTPAPDRPREPETGKFTTKPEPKPEPAKAPEKPVAEPKPEPAKPEAEFEPPQIAKPSELRSYAKKMGARAQQAEQNLSKLNAKIRELETRPQQSGDIKALTEELATTKKRLEEHESEIKVTRYERSQEFKDKYEKPYQSAYKEAYSDMGELIVREQNPEDPDNPTRRSATTADFDEILNLKLGPAGELAEKKFGVAGAATVMGHYKAIKKLAKDASTAITDHSKNADSYEQQQTAQKKLEMEGRTQMFSHAKQAIGEKYPELFGPREKDATWNEALTKGRSMADLAFSDRTGLTPEQSAILDAQVHARISAFPGLRQERDAFKAKVEALEKENAQLRGSGPGKPSAAAPKSEAPTDMTLDQAFDKMIPS